MLDRPKHWSDRPWSEQRPPRWRGRQWAGRHRQSAAGDYSADTQEPKWLRRLAEYTPRGPEAITLAEALQTDVVLMDVQMPGGSGISATREIVAASPHIRVLVVVLFEDDSD